MPAPASPPISACEDELGRPSHHVSRFHVIAPINAARITYAVACLGSMMPLAMALATAVPKTKAATKLKNAAQITASFGDSTRVDTTVAMLFAASWKPLMKSNTSAITIVINTISIEALTSSLPAHANGYFPWSGSGALQQNGFQHVGRVFSFVRGRFEHFVEFLQLDEIDGIFFFLEELGNSFTGDLVSNVLQPVYLHAVRHDVAAL